MLGSWSQSLRGIWKEDCNVIVHTSIKVNLLTVEIGHLLVSYMHIVLLRRKELDGALLRDWEFEQEYVA